jgi:hypothetical protein
MAVAMYEIYMLSCTFLIKLFRANAAAIGQNLMAIPHLIMHLILKVSFF